MGCGASALPLHNGVEPDDDSVKEFLINVRLSQPMEANQPTPKNSISSYRDSLKDFIVNNRISISIRKK